MGMQSRSRRDEVAQTRELRWTVGVILALTAILLLSACTRERIAEEVGNSLGEQPQEPVVTQLTPLPTATETPVPTPEDTPAPKVITYEVQPGDTISAISEKFGTDPQRIRALNLLTTDHLQVGQVLRGAQYTRRDNPARDPHRHAGAIPVHSSGGGYATVDCAPLRCLPEPTGQR